LLVVLAVPWAPWTFETEATLVPATEVGLEAPDDGTVVSVRAREGDPIQKDEVVAVLESPAVSSSLAGASAAREALRKRMNIQREAADAPGLYHAEHRQAAADLAVQRDEERLERLSVRSPIAGRILTRRTQDLPGRFVAAGASIVRVGDCATLKAEIPVT